MVDVTMEIETTRDIARQMLRHRSFSFQEFSQRYSDVSSLGDMFEYSEVRMQDLKNRQNSVETEDEDTKVWWETYQRGVVKYCETIYKEALAKGIAKEVARKVLPEGLTKSRMYMKGSLRSWIHYLDLRCSNGTQLEHQQIAREIKRIFCEQFPIIGEAAFND